MAILATMLSVATAFVAAPAGAVRTPGEIVRYDFTDGSGSTVSDSGSGAPLNLTIGNSNNVTWVPGGGLSVDSATIVSSSGAASKVFAAVTATNEMTVEAWIDPANNTQGGPARIVSSEGSSTARNFMLGQGAWSSLPDDTYAVRFRTTASLKGEPTLFTPAGTATTGLTHVVMTRTAAGNITTYVDGVVEATQTRTGDLSNWASSYPLTVANLGNATRPWIGTLCQVAIYDTALTPGEVTDNFTAGCGGGANTDPELDPIVDQSDAEGDPVSVPVTASDADPGDVLTFSATGLPDGVTIDSATGTMSGTITQTAATGSPYSVEVTADDGRGGVVSTTFTWNVTAVNVDPVLDPIGNLLSGLGQAISLTVTATDSDNDTLTFSATGLPTGLTINPATGEITGTTTATGTFSTTVTVDDPNGGTDFETFDWMVVGNDDPILDPIGPQSDSEGDTISLPVTANDPNTGDDLTFSATGLPDGLTINPTTGTITGTITQTAATGSPYSTTVTVDDGVGGTADETLQWDIAAVNVAPQGTNPGTQTDNEGNVVSLTIAATDADNDTLTFGATGLPTGLSINTATGAITGTIAAGAATGSPYSTTVTISDGTDTTPIAFTWNVSVITGPAPVVRYDFTDGSGSTVSDSGSGAPLNLTIANPGNVTWIPGGGLSVDSATIVSSSGAASKVFAAVTATNEMTVEAWVQPTNNTQSGPARIVSSAADPFARNFMLGQGAYSNLPDDTYAVRFRTTNSASGTPELFTPAGTATTGLTHVVMTRTAAGNITTYVDGVVEATQTRTGTLANWDLTYPLTIANLGNGARPWLGTLCQVAIYDQALTPTEVGDNYTAGCDLPAPPAAALVQVTPNGGIGATTFGNATITATNTGGPGAPSITKVEFDLRGSVIPDATFDPIGTAGDEGTQCLAVSSEGGTGFVVPADECSDPFSLLHEDSPGVPGNGWDGMTLDFTDFDGGEAIVFGVDVDPTTIQGVPGSGGAGAVSGLELSGSPVTVTFSDGTVLTGQLFGDGSLGGGQAVLSEVSGLAGAPGIEMLGVTTTPTVFPNNSNAGFVPTAGTQTVQVSGPVGAAVTLLAIEGALPNPAAFDLDLSESDEATAVTYLTGTVGAGGFVDFSVDLTSESSLYHYLAAIDDGSLGDVSPILVIGIGDVETPIVDPIANVVVEEGDTIAVPINAIDPNGDPITLGITSTPDIEALGAVLTDNTDGTGSLDWITETGDADTYTIDITAFDGTNTGTTSFTIVVNEPGTTQPAAALVQITPGGVLGATTFGNSTILVTNDGGPTSPDIAAVSFDLRGSLIPDATFDPIGTAGDAGTQCLEVSSEGGTGFVVPGDNCFDPFSLPHEDSPGVIGNGWDGMTLDFTDFGLGETIVFGVDVDPTTIQGVPGAGGAGAVSGLELSGSSVTVTFSDGQVLTGQLFGDGSAGGGEVLVSSELGQLAPTGIEMLGVTTAPTVFPNNSRAGNVAAAGPQTVRVTGPEGATVNLIAVDGQLQSPTPFDPDPFESDTATAIAYQTGVISGGSVDFTVTVANANDLYHFVATIDDGGANGPLTEILVIGVGDVDTPVIDPIANVAVTEGDTIAVPISATDPNTDPITLGIVSTPDIEALGAVLTDNTDGTGSLDWVTEAGDAGVYNVDITAFDGTNTGTTSFTIVVSDPNAEAIYRINSGGPQVAATDGGIPWDEDQSVAGSNFGGTAVAGTPSEYLISGGENAYGTADPIDLTDPSVPSGTPEALFQTEHWDPATGSEMVYEFAVGSGAAYQVDLYFAEIFATADGVRQFAVDIEGVPVLNNYDIHAVAGHDAGVVASFVSPIIADDFLTITFTHQVENPKVNAIEVSPTGPPPTDVPPTIGLIADKGVTVGGSLPVAITTTEPDGDVVTLGYSSVPDASSFTTFADAGDGSGTLTFAPIAGDTGVYDITVTATDNDGTDTETFALTVSDPPVAGTVFARINSAGPLVPAIDGGPDWEADANPGHPFLTNGGSDGNAGFPAVEPGPTVPTTVAPEIFDTERWSDSGFSYGIPVPTGTQVFVRLFLGNGFTGTNQAGQRVFDISIDGAIVQDDFDMIPAFGDLTGGMLEYLVTSDGTVDISFANVIQNPLVNGIEVVSAASSPDVLGASPTAVDFGATLVNGSQDATVTLSNLGFEAGDPTITVTSVVASGGEFSTDFSGPVAIGPAGSTVFTATFSPTSVGAQSGILTITHSGSNSPVTVTLDGTGSNNIPVSFDSTGLTGESSNNPTSLQFGPDGRLYVAQQDGTIKAYTIQRNSATDYAVTATETINLIKTDTTNHDDDGSTNPSTSRQMTGLLATGTTANPVIYVTSSDNRIAVGNDTGLDTNSGVVTRLTWNGASWDKVDIVRGLPRSEENHSTNGLALDEVTNTLYVIQGGHANKGAPGNNFSGTPEYYLSAALLSVDLDAITALGTFTDARDGAEVAYDLRTLDDPTRANITNADAGFPYPVGHPLYGASIDVGDPFGGNNGVNQAIPEPGGPVQIYSPGFRNAFDVVFTSQGRLYTSDNGPNTGWGGQPLVYTSTGVAKGTGPFNQGAGDYCTNEFNESASNSHGDPLHFVDGPGYYGGHPAPIRAFPELSRVIVYVNSGGWTEAGNYNFYDLLPPDLSPASFPDNPIECEYSANDPGKYIDIINASTNGITEYTASNFGGALQGNIFTASFDGNIYSYQLNAAGDASVDKQALFSGFGSQPLDVTAQGDGDPFPGTVWAATYGADNITVFEPADSSSCTGVYDINLDEDNDGYSNADEIDNGTNPCSAGDKPTDNDGDNLSDLNDDDDDNDGILDVDDEFAIDAANGTATAIPVLRPFLNSDPGTDFFGLGLTGLMTNGTTDYLNQFNPDDLNAGGNGGQFGVEIVTAGDAYQTDNTQDNGFQYGIDADTTTAPFVVSSAVLPPLFDGLTPANFQSAGIQIGTGDQDNYLKMVVNANGGLGGIEVLKEEAGTATLSTQYGAADIGGNLLTATSSIELKLVVDPAALTVQAQASIDGGTLVDLGTPVPIPASWLDAGDAQGLAVGLISTSTGAGPEFAASWDYLDVEFVGATTNTPPTVDPIVGQSVAEGDPFSLGVVATDPDAGDTLVYALSGEVPVGMTIDAAGVIDFTPDLDDSGSYDLTVEVDDGVNPAVTEDFTLDVTQTAPPGSAIYRVNVGGPNLPAVDGSYPDWAVDTDVSPSPYLVAGGTNIFNGTATDFSHPSVPATVPPASFNSERWDAAGMTYSFPVDTGTDVEVRLQWAELFSGITAPGQRVIDVAIDGVPAGSVDPFAEAGFAGAYVSDYLVTSDGSVDITLSQNVQNPALKGIEILGVAGEPSVSLLGALDGSTVTTSSLTVEWMLNGFTEPTDHVHFMIDGGDAAGTPGAHDTIMRPNTSIDLTGLADGSHTVSVQVADVAHVLYTNPAALDTATFTVSVPTTPPAPSGVAAVDGDTVVDLDWDDVAGATGYNVYRGTTTGVTSVTGTLLTPTPATTSDFSDATAVNGTIYFYVVTAVNAFGESPDSAEVSGHPLPDLLVLERINAGGALVTAADGPNQDWEGDTSAANHPTLTDPGTNGNSGGAVADRDPSVPSYVPQAIVTTERWSNNGTTDNPFTYDIDVPPGSTVDVRLFFGNSCACTQNAGQRAFNVTIEGVQELTDFDPSATFGHLTGGMVRFDSVVDDGDGVLTVTFSKGLIENPMVNAIEVRQVSLDATAPLFTDPTTFSFPIAENSTVVGDAVTDDAFAAITVSGGADELLFDVVDNADGSATVSFLAAPDFEDPLDVGGDNTYEIELTATDGAGNPTVQPFTVDVFDIVVENLPPSLDPIGPQTVAEGTLLTVNPVATDLDDPTLGWSLQNEPAGMTIDGATGEITFTPDGDDSGTYMGITVVVNDGTNPDVTTDFDLTVMQNVIGVLRYAYNAGGPTSGIFVEDTNANPAPERSGGTLFGSANQTVDVSGPTVPIGTPADVFNTERYGDQTWTFPVSPGAEVEVLVYLAEVFDSASPTSRSFDVSIDGVVLPEATGINLFVDPGNEVATVIDRRYVDADGSVEVVVTTIIDNAKISAIEVREINAGPNVAPLITADPLTLSVEEETIGTADADATDVNPFDSLTFSLDTPPSWAAIDPVTGEMTFTPTTGDASPTPYAIKVDVTDGSLADTVDVDVTVTPTATADPLVVDKWVYGAAMYRVNAGGPLVTAIDGGPDWTANTNADLPGFLDPDYANSDPSELAVSSGASITPDATIPSSTPLGIFETERWDPGQGGEMQWNFPATVGDFYEVRLFFADSNGPTQAVGARVFDVSIDDELVLDDFDIYDVTGQVANIGTMRRFVIVADADGIDIDFDRMVENPEIRGIEIVPLETALTGPSGADYDYVTRITNPASNSQVATLTGLTDTVNGGTPTDISAGCETALGALAANESLVCRFSSTHTGAGGATFDDVVGVTGSFSGGGSADTASNTVTVTISTNADPVLDPVADQAVFPGELIDIAFSATDADVGDTLTLSLSSVPALPAGAVFDDGAGTGVGGLTWTPGPADTGIYAVTLTVSDGNGGIANQPFQVLVGESLPLLINAGAGAPPTDWVSDAGYRAGGNTAGTITAIDLTDPSLVDTPAVEAMLQTESWGPQTWTAVVPDGTYEVRLYFAETFAGLPDQDARFFDVAIEGTQVLDDFKPWAEAGARNKGVARSFTVEVTDGNGVGIELINQTGGDNAAIKGVEIREVVFQANAGAGAAGTWDPATGFVTGGTAFPTGATIALDPTAPLTTPQAVLQNELFGDPLTWAIPVEDATSYEVRLYLVETFQTAPGSRTFGVTIEGLPWLTDYEMLDEVAQNVLVVKRYFLTSTDTVLDIVMDATQDNATVKGVEIIAN